MTRDKAKEIFWNDTVVCMRCLEMREEMNGFIDTIFDDFESRTCENCMYWQGNIETSSKGICTQLGVHNIGGCGDYFERKKEC